MKLTTLFLSMSITLAMLLFSWGTANAKVPDCPTLQSTGTVSWIQALPKSKILRFRLARIDNASSDRTTPYGYRTTFDYPVAARPQALVDESLELIRDSYVRGVPITVETAGGRLGCAVLLNDSLIVKSVSTYSRPWSMPPVESQ